MSRALHALGSDLPQLAEALASAFLDDPISCWMFEDPECRLEQLRTWMRFAVEMGITRGHLYTAGGNLAASIWSPPDVTLFDDLWVPRMLKVLSDLLGERAGEVLAALARVIGAEGSDEPHFYLFVLGTHAAHQSRGLGGQVLEPVLARCDEQRLPARLESSNPRNVPFYERHGFEVLGEVAVVPGGPVIRPMRREPRAG